MNYSHGSRGQRKEFSSKADLPRWVVLSERQGSFQSYLANCATLCPKFSLCMVSIHQRRTLTRAPHSKLLQDHSYPMQDAGFVLTLSTFQTAYLWSQLRFKGIIEYISSQFRVLCKSHFLSFLCSSFFSSHNPLGFLSFFPTFTLFTLFIACCTQKGQPGLIRKRWWDRPGTMCSSLVATLQGLTKLEETQWWRHKMIQEMRDRGLFKDKSWRSELFSLQR